MKTNSVNLQILRILIQTKFDKIMVYTFYQEK